MTHTARAQRPLSALDVAGLFNELLERHGPQGWWPARTPFEMMVGAILVQNTNWRNVEKSIARLDDAGLLDARAMLAARLDELQETIRPSGFMKAKSRACLGLAEWATRNGWPSLASARDLPTAQLRASLLTCRGVGPETADVILLYVFERAVFIADRYAMRVLAARGYAVPTTYERLRAVAEAPLAASALSAEQAGELHALIIAEGKTVPVTTAAGGR
ncbi:MAG: deoxyribonuclease [Actinomycetaceae bacterium]|nr:deoxyribonuclease [Actinomycetaceae bacterium]